MPGVPDVYQGTELWEDSLVDPDNRRPVDYAQRARGADRTELDDPKLRAVTAAARCGCGAIGRPSCPRRRLPPCRPQGDAAEHVVAFDRGGALRWPSPGAVGPARRSRLGRHRVGPAGNGLDRPCSRGARRRGRSTRSTCSTAAGRAAGAIATRAGGKPCMSRVRGLGTRPAAVRLDVDGAAVPG